MIKEKFSQTKDETVADYFVKYMIITVASFFYGVGVTLFLDPNNVIPGGVTGIAMILNRFTNVPIGTLILIINIPILLLGLKKFGIRFLISTIYATAVVSFFTDLLQPYGALTDSMLLSSLMGNVLIAVSLAVVFRMGATTGGMDIIVKLLRLRFPHIKTGTLFFLADIVIICSFGILFQNMDATIYALIGIVVMSVVFDNVMYGRDEAKMIYIVSDYSNMIAKRILSELDIGVTYLEGQGAYSGKRQNIILCVMRKNKSIRVEEIVKETDRNAFLIITNATEIYGEGYKDISAGKL